LMNKIIKQQKEPLFWFDFNYLIFKIQFYSKIALRINWKN
jgi:hypothetical protein